MSTRWNRNRNTKRTMMSRGGEAVDAERNVPGVATRKPCFMSLRDIEAISAPELPPPTRRTPPLPQLCGTAIVERMQLSDAGIELFGEGRRDWLLEVRHRDHDVVRVEPLVTRGDEEPVSSPR